VWRGLDQGDGLLAGQSQSRQQAHAGCGQYAGNRGCDGAERGQHDVSGVLKQIKNDKAIKFNSKVSRVGAEPRVARSNDAFMPVLQSTGTRGGTQPVLNLAFFGGRC